MVQRNNKPSELEITKGPKNFPVPAPNLSNSIPETPNHTKKIQLPPYEAIYVQGTIDICPKSPLYDA